MPATVKAVTVACVTPSERAEAAMALWLHDLIRAKRQLAGKHGKPTSWRDIAEDIGVSHPWTMRHGKKPQRQLGKDLENRIVEKYFGGSRDRFREEALRRFGDAVAEPPRAAGSEPKRYRADPVALESAAEILIAERDVKRRESVFALAPFTYFDNEEDARNVHKLVTTFYEMIKGGSPGGARSPGSPSQGQPSS